MSSHLKKHVVTLHGKDFIIFYDDRITNITEVKNKMRKHLVKYLKDMKQTKLL